MRVFFLCLTCNVHLCLAWVDLCPPLMKWWMYSMLLYSTWIVTSKQQLFTSPRTVVMSCWKAVLLSLYFLLMFYIETLTAKIRKDAVNSLYTMSNRECPLYSISNTWRRNQYVAATKNWLVVIYCTVYLDCDRMLQNGWFCLPSKVWISLDGQWHICGNSWMMLIWQASHWKLTHV